MENIQFAERMGSIRTSVVRELAKYLSDPEVISFSGGNPANSSFPVEQVDEITHDLLMTKGRQLLQYGTTSGYKPLIEAYIEHIAAPKGLAVSEDHVITLTGSMQGLDLLCKVLLNPGDTVLVEAPTFAGALNVFRIYQANIVSVDMDDEGIMVDQLEEIFKTQSPKLFYCIPTFQNPTGKTLGLERRKSIAELAYKYNVIVIEDDPYGDLRFSGEAVPPIKIFDPDDRIIYLNSFSKILSPGLRVATMLGNPEILKKACVAKQSCDTHTANLNQAIAAEFLNRGLLPGHLAKILPPYKVQLDTMLKAMDDHFPSCCSYTRPEGGLFIWGEFQKDINMTDMMYKAIQEEKVAFVPGQTYFVGDTQKRAGTFRLNFSNATVDQINDGIRRLGRLFREVIAE
ncbi:MAG: PLP-dependent aminotransferase family protein [Mogibacterium sp.]|nr:PLP-dependent aminotransferase family protein [Mogibacterium sp.]